jgi:hypothetical protein
MFAVLKGEEIKVEWGDGTRERHGPSSAHVLTNPKGGCPRIKLVTRDVFRPITLRF